MRSTCSGVMRLIAGIESSRIKCCGRTQEINSRRIDRNPGHAGIVIQRAASAPQSKATGVLISMRYAGAPGRPRLRSEEHTSELQSLRHLVCRLLLEKKKKKHIHKKHTKN